MYNKKCINTFLFCSALVSLITLILPFINVNFFGDVSVVLKILYYFSIVVFSLCIVAIILIGVLSFVKNSYSLAPVQEFLSFCAFAMLLLTVFVFLPVNGANLTVGYSILLLESFVMAFLSSFIKLLRKLPRSFKLVVDSIKQKKLQKQKILEEKEKLEKLSQETAQQNAEQNSNNSYNNSNDLNSNNNDFDEVKIIPPSENDDIDDMV